MNLDLHNILQTHQLGNLIEQLSEEGINDIETFISLEKDEIEVVAPRIGDRAKMRNVMKLLSVQKSDLHSASSADTIILENVYCDDFSEDKTFVIQAASSPAATIDIPEIINSTPASSSHEPPKKKSKILIDKFDKCSIMKMIQESGRGKLVLDYYTEKQQLASNIQDALVQIIVDSLMHNLNCSINSEGFRKLANIISSIFPNESKEVYFIERLTEKRKVACGKLYSRYVNNKALLKRCHSKEKSTEVEAPESEMSNTQENDILWLKHNSEPWETVMEKWKSTSDFRVKSQNVESDTIAVTQKWPLLKHARGYILIENDYSVLYPNHESLNYMSIWERTVEKLFHLVQSDKKGKLNKKFNEYITDDERDLALLSVLPRCLGSSLRRFGGKSWKPTFEECQEGFIKHVDDISEIEKTLGERSTKYKSLGLSLQPSIFAVHHKDNSVSYYVTFDTIKFKFSTVLKAVGVAFYIYQVYNLCYPYEASSCWTFLQRSLFKLTLKCDKVSASTANFENLLNLPTSEVLKTS